MLYINNSDMEVITIVLRRLVFLTTQVAEDSTFDWGAAGMPPIKAVKMVKASGLVCRYSLLRLIADVSAIDRKAPGEDLLRKTAGKLK